MSRPVLALVLAITGAAPAAAVPASPDLLVWIDKWSGSTATVCAAGTVDDGSARAGRWTLTMRGTAATPPDVTTTGTSFALTCRNLTLGTGGAGVFVAELSFVTGGVLAPAERGGVSDVAGTAGLAVEWAPGVAPTEQTYTTSD